MSHSIAILYEHQADSRGNLTVQVSKNSYMHSSTHEHISGVTLSFLNVKSCCAMNGETIQPVRDKLADILKERLETKGIACRITFDKSRILITAKEGSDRTSDTMYDEALAAVDGIHKTSKKTTNLSTALDHELETTRAHARDTPPPPPQGPRMDYKTAYNTIMSFFHINAGMALIKDARDFADRLATDMAKQMPGKADVETIPDHIHEAGKDPLYDLVKKTAENNLPDSHDGKRDYIVSEVASKLRDEYRYLGQCRTLVVRSQA